MKGIIAKGVLAMFLIWSAVVPISAECPSADLTGDCRVDLEDFVIFASQWLYE